MCLNVISIKNKFDAFNQLIKSTEEKFRIIGLTETWLDDSNYKYFDMEGYDFISVHRDSKIGGRIVMYVDQDLQHKSRNDLSININDTVESTFMEITTEIGKNIVNRGIYRPPNNRIAENLSFENAINETLSKVDKENEICYLMVDCNLNLLKSKSCDVAKSITEQRSRLDHNIEILFI